MEIKVGDVKSSTENKGHFFLKRACVDVIISSPADDYKIKISHESKAFSDFFFHKDFSLINKNFIFYFQNKSGVWYNFPTLEKLIQFIGIVVELDLFKSTIDKVLNDSMITEVDI